MLPTVAQDPFRIEAYGEVTPAPGTVQFVITIAPGADPHEVEMLRATLSETLKRLVKTTDLHPLTEQRLFT